MSTEVNNQARTALMLSLVTTEGQPYSVAELRESMDMAAETAIVAQDDAAAQQAWTATNAVACLIGLTKAVDSATEWLWEGDNR